MERENISGKIEEARKALKKAERKKPDFADIERAVSVLEIFFAGDEQFGAIGENAHQNKLLEKFGDKDFGYDFGDLETAAQTACARLQSWGIDAEEASMRLINRRLDSVDPSLLGIVKEEVLKLYPGNSPKLRTS